MFRIDREILNIFKTELMLFGGKMQVAGCKSDTQSEFAVGKLVVGIGVKPCHRHGVNR